MKVAVFWGCKILANQYAYEMSVRETFLKLGVELVDLKEVQCCGDPVKSINDFAANYLGVRVLALANQTDVTNLLVPCNRCHFAVSEAKHRMDGNEKAQNKLAGLLNEEGLKYSPDVRIWHTIDFLHDHVGLDRVRKAVVKPLKSAKFAVHYGCQILRYSDLGRVDDAEDPRKLDRLINAIGAETVDYSEKLDCCGSHLLYSHVDSASSLAGTKLRAIQALNVDGLVVSCPDCGTMFDARQKEAATTVGAKLALPVLYYTQLLGLALGVPHEKLGLQLNQSPVDQILSKVLA